MDALMEKALVEKECCEASGCSESVVIALAGLGYCLDHFVAKCYDRLGLLESMIRARTVDSALVRSADTLLEECSRQTAHVCLCQRDLSNLERSRLLDILLLCGEVQEMLQNPLLGLDEPDSRDPNPASPENSSREQN